MITYQDAFRFLDFILSRRSTATIVEFDFYDTALTLLLDYCITQENLAGRREEKHQWTRLIERNPLSKE